MRNLLCVLFLFVMLGCSNMESSNESVPTVSEPVAYAPSEVPEKIPERKLIRNGSMSFEVDDVSATRQKITELATQFGGYIASEKKSSDWRHEQVIRIPGNQFDGFISKLETFAKRVDEQDFSSEDVTEQYVDLESRFAAKRKVEARFLEIVKQVKTIKDILDVEQEIGIVRSEIEQIEGKIKYLSSKTSYSTITLTFYKNTPVELPGTVSKFAESFTDGWDGMVAFMIAITRTWPFLLVIGFIAWLVMRRKRKEPVQVIQQQ